MPSKFSPVTTADQFSELYDIWNDHYEEADGLLDEEPSAELEAQLTGNFRLAEEILERLIKGFAELGHDDQQECEGKYKAAQKQTTIAKKHYDKWIKNLSKAKSAR
jgi:hypothetical protein